MNTNGWSFWQVLDAGGKKRTLLDIRTAYLAALKAKGDGNR